MPSTRGSWSFSWAKAVGSSHEKSQSYSETHTPCHHSALSAPHRQMSASYGGEDPAVATQTWAFSWSPYSKGRNPSCLAGIISRGRQLHPRLPRLRGGTVGAQLILLLETKLQLKRLCEMNTYWTFQFLQSLGCFWKTWLQWTFSHH